MRLRDTGGAEPWKEENYGKEFDFEIVTADCCETVRGVIDLLGGTNKMALTEMVETGSGTFKESLSIGYTSDAAKQPISRIGWTEKRGSTLPPVWLVLHEA